MVSKSYTEEDALDLLPLTSSAEVASMQRSTAAHELLGVNTQVKLREAFLCVWPPENTADLRGDLDLTRALSQMASIVMVSQRRGNRPRERTPR